MRLPPPLPVRGMSGLQILADIHPPDHVLRGQDMGARADLPETVAVTLVPIGLAVEIGVVPNEDSVETMAVEDEGPVRSDLALVGRGPVELAHPSLRHRTFKIHVLSGVDMNHVGVDDVSVAAGHSSGNDVEVLGILDEFLRLLEQARGSEGEGPHDANAVDGVQLEDIRQDDGEHGRMGGVLAVDAVKATIIPLQRVGVGKEARDVACG